MEEALEKPAPRAPVQRQKSRKSVPLFNSNMLGALGVSSSPAVQQPRSRVAGASGLPARPETASSPVSPTSMTLDSRFRVAAVLVRGA